MEEARELKVLGPFLCPKICWSNPSTHRVPYKVYINIRTDITNQTWEHLYERNMSKQTNQNISKLAQKLWLKHMLNLISKMLSKLTGAQALQMQSSARKIGNKNVIKLHIKVDDKNVIKLRGGDFKRIFKSILKSRSVAGFAAHPQTVIRFRFVRESVPDTVKGNTKLWLPSLQVPYSKSLRLAMLSNLREVEQRNSIPIWPKHSRRSQLTSKLCASLVSAPLSRKKSVLLSRQSSARIGRRSMPPIRSRLTTPQLDSHKSSVARWIPPRNSVARTETSKAPV